MTIRNCEAWGVQSHSKLGSGADFLTKWTTIFGASRLDAITRVDPDFQQKPFAKRYGDSKNRAFEPFLSYLQKILTSTVEKRQVVIMASQPTPLSYPPQK